jgi:predicted ATPase
MERYVLTGTPGAGKTTILDALAARGYPVVAEAATALIELALANGDDRHWERADFIDAIVARQRRLQLEADEEPAAVRFYDRSPVCTLALSRHLGRPVSPALAAELDRIDAAQVYRPMVFFVRSLGFVRPTPVRRISYEQSLEFERIHETVYRSRGFTLVEVPAGPVAGRVEVVLDTVRQAGRWLRSRPGPASAR